MATPVRTTQKTAQQASGQMTIPQTNGLVGGIDFNPRAKKALAPPTRADIEREARPGESYEQAAERLQARRAQEREASVARLVPFPQAGETKARDAGIALCARELVLVTLPHSDPGPEAKVFERKNGNLTLRIESGTDAATGKLIGIPYGSIPRLILYFIVAEINRTGKPRVSLGKSWAELARKLGLESDSGGPKSSIRYLKEQLRRLLAAKIEFIVEDRRMAALAKDSLLANRSIRWWPSKDPGPDMPMESWLEVGNAFFQAASTKPIPVRLATVVVLRKSPMALDFYALLCRESALAAENKHGRTIAWAWLMKQLGADYRGKDGLKNFARNASKALETIKAHYPKLRVNAVKGGIEILDDTQPDVEMRA